MGEWKARKMMKAIICVSLMFIGIATAQSQTPSAPEPAKKIDWAQLDPRVLDLAFDWFDAVKLQIEAIRADDTVWAPREADSVKLESKVSRLKESAADEEAYSAVAKVYQDVMTARRTFGRDGDPIFDILLSGDEKGAAQRLHEIKLLYSAALKGKQEAPAAR
jgi:hypothetical protein